MYRVWTYEGGEHLQVLKNKLKEVIMAVLPIVGIVLLLNFTITQLDGKQLGSFLTGALLVTVGLTLFLFGVDLGISPIGRYIGGAIVKRNSLLVLTIYGLILGFLISIEEPDLHILAGQVDLVTGGMLPKLQLVVMVSIGIAVMLTLGFIRIVYNISLKLIFFILYGLVLVGGLLAPQELLAISFDSSGATTGAMTVPFILALALGISALRKDSRSSEADSFGLVGISSVGAILAVMVMSIFSSGGIAEASDELVSHGSSDTILERLLTISGEVILEAKSWCSLYDPIVQGFGSSFTGLYRRG